MCLLLETKQFLWVTQINTHNTEWNDHWCASDRKTQWLTGHFVQLLMSQLLLTMEYAVLEVITASSSTCKTITGFLPAALLFPWFDILAWVVLKTQSEAVWEVFLCVHVVKHVSWYKPATATFLRQWSSWSQLVLTFQKLVSKHDHGPAVQLNCGIPGLYEQCLQCTCRIWCCCYRLVKYGCQEDIFNS